MKAQIPCGLGFFDAWKLQKADVCFYKSSKLPGRDGQKELDFTGNTSQFHFMKEREEKDYRRQHKNNDAA